MVTRRRFMKQLSMGLAAGVLGWPRPADSFLGSPRERCGEDIRVALLADAHVPDDNPESRAARNLRAAVTEINALSPPVDLVLLAGDLTDRGDLGALLLGKEILSALPAPCWLVPGEKDCPAAPGSPWKTIFNHGTFSFRLKNVHFIGLDTSAIHSVSGHSFFQVTAEQCRWLARELTHSLPESPLLILSHAPLYRLFQPWQWWTEQAEILHDLLGSQDKVYLLHGHVHQNITLRQGNLTFQGLRSTAWPLPDVRIGLTTSQNAPAEIGTSPGCGWMLLTISSNHAVILHDRVWEI